MINTYDLEEVVKKAREGNYAVFGQLVMDEIGFVFFRSFTSGLQAAVVAESITRLEQLRQDSNQLYNPKLKRVIIKRNVKNREDE